MTASQWVRALPGRDVRRILFSGLLLLPWSLRAEPVEVRHSETLPHSFLVLCTLKGDTLASGDLFQSAKGDTVDSRLAFHFKDGSLRDETARFSQRGYFRLLSYHLVQKGPAFPIPIEVAVDRDSGRISVRYTEDGKENFAVERMNLPSDLSNGLVPLLVENFPGGARSMTVSLAAATPKLRMVKLVITPQGEDSLRVGTSLRKATEYRIKAELEGMVGWMAPLVGKQPPDIHVWILSGGTPAFVRSEGPFFLDGPVWRIERTDLDRH